MKPIDGEILDRLLSAVFGAEDDGQAAACLEALGFDRPEDSFRSFKRIILPIGPCEEAERLALVLLETTSNSADLDMALANWERFFEASFSRSVLASLLIEHPQRTERLSTLFGHSQFLADILVRNPEYAEWLEMPEARADKSLEAYEAEIAEALALFHEDDSRRDALCRYQRREILRIGFRDVMGWAPLERIVAEISDLAQAIVRTALKLCQARLQRRFGIPQVGEGPSPCGFAVIAMGKLGGRELNYSSDIDLIFVYDSDGVTSGVLDTTGHRAGGISNREYFAKLGTALIDFLSRHGPESYLYRVDMRLRPEGLSGALAHSFEFCQSYYLGRARLWERIALLKARGIAGDEKLIEQFERLAEGFVFSPALPETLLEEIARLKDRIDAEVAASKHADREIKRGPGGIREIEFIVAALQILHGQTRPRLRLRSTLEAIGALAKEHLIAPEETRLLDSAYRFLRLVEHRLQCMAWRQTHLLPSDEREIAALAIRCGIAASTRAEAAARFESERRKFASAVHKRFNEIFRPAGLNDKAERERAALRLIESDLPPEEVEKTLGRWHLRDPSTAAALKRLAHGSTSLYVSAEGQRHFEQILPALLETCRRMPWPDDAVRRFESFIQASGDPAGYYSLVAENRPILDLLVRLFGTSGILSEKLIANPGWFDSLLEPETFGEVAEWLEREAARLLDRSLRDPEKRLGAMHEFSSFGSLRIVLRYILGLASWAETSRTLSTLAETCVETALRWALDDTAGERGDGVSGGGVAFSVLGLGKLGRRELTLLSDLDVVFVSDPAAKTGSRGDGPDTFFARIAERLIFYLTDPRAGSATFRVDARLRPEGRGSPLVTTIERFRRHFEHSPEVWEIQTYLGGRAIAGDLELGDGALAIVADAAKRLGPATTVGREILAMRRRLEESVRLPPWAAADFKRGPGGLVDLEFAAQFFQIAHAGERPELLRAAPLEVIEEARTRGWLDDADSQAFADDYSFLRQLEADVRLILESQQTCFPADPARLEALARAPWRTRTKPESLRSTFEQSTKRVRALFGKILESSESGEGTPP